MCHLSPLPHAIWLFCLCGFCCFVVGRFSCSIAGDTTGNGISIASKNCVYLYYYYYHNCCFIKTRTNRRTMGRLYLIQLDGRIYSCKHCRSHLAQCDELVSKVLYSCRLPSRFDNVPQFDTTRFENVHDDACSWCCCLLFVVQSFHSRNGKAYLFNTV